MSQPRRMIAMVFAAALAATAMAVYWVSPVAWLIVQSEVLVVAGIFLTALTLGVLPVRFLLKSMGLTLGQKVVSAVAIGVPALAICVMLAGWAGVMNAFVWRALIAAGGLGGFAIVYAAVRREWGQEDGIEPGRVWSVVLVALAPVAVMTMLAATMPPGILWHAEGNGYDVLEYHLQVPKEWFQAGQISFLEHNIYANLPFNGELLYLLAMILRGGPMEAIYLSQLIHAALGALTLFAAWTFVRPWSAGPAAWATLAIGACPWMAYLMPLAYNEMGALFVATVAVGLIVRSLWGASPMDWRGLVVVGLLLGAVAGYKYTFAAMIVPAVVFAWVIDGWRRVGVMRMALGVIVIGVAAVVAIGPYWVRNACWTGNPVFPIAYERLGGRGWTDELAKRWKDGHRPRAEEQSFGGRMDALYFGGLRNVLTDGFVAQAYKDAGRSGMAQRLIAPVPIQDLPTFGFGVLLLPAVIFFTRRQTVNDWVLAGMLAVMTVVWLVATHLQGRFLLPWLAVVPFLLGRTLQTTMMAGAGRWAALVIVLSLSVARDLSESASRFVRHVGSGGQALNLYGGHDFFVKGSVPGAEYLGVVNAAEAPAGPVMLIGNACPFYVQKPTIYWTVFNRNAFAEHVSAKGLRELKTYLAEVRPAFIYVDWMEITRLGSTYGFDASIKPAIFKYLGSPPTYRVKTEDGWGRWEAMNMPWRVLYKLEYGSSPSKSAVGAVGAKLVPTAGVGSVGAGRTGRAGVGRAGSAGKTGGIVKNGPEKAENDVDRDGRGQ